MSIKNNPFKPQKILQITFWNRKKRLSIRFNQYGSRTWKTCKICTGRIGRHPIGLPKTIQEQLATLPIVQ
jgi:hypothetical protein